MRLRPIEQMATKVAVALDDSEPDMATLVRQRLPNVRHQMWNGQWHAAIARMKLIYQGTYAAATRKGQTVGEHMQRFRKHLRDLRDYLVNNQTSLTTIYGLAAGIWTRDVSKGARGRCASQSWHCVDRLLQRLRRGIALWRLQAVRLGTRDG
jgi:hypothetical protein